MRKLTVIFIILSVFVLKLNSENRGSVLSSSDDPLKTSGAKENKFQFLRSSGGECFLILQPEDGNLVLYRGSGPADQKGYLWHTETIMNSNPFSKRLVMQSNGNLVLYWGETIKWASGTEHGNGKYFLAMQSDCNLVIYQGTPSNKGHAVWSWKHGRIPLPIPSSSFHN